MNPKYPVYIISKSRWDSRLTSRAFEKMGVPYKIVVERSQRTSYTSVIDSQKVLILPEHYLEEYDACDDLGLTKSKGPGAARNFCWDNAIALGADRHWVLDDNISGFGRQNRNLYARVTSGTIFCCAEDFVDRYENIAIAGFNYDFFVKSKQKVPAFVLNTRIYSCLLIKNDIPYRWRGRYNEDTDLCLRALKDGLCTVQFNAFLQEKAGTQTLKGGNTEVFYKNIDTREGTHPKSKMLQEMHPDVTTIVWKFKRWHHHVDYIPFKKNKLILKEGVIIPRGVNNYGMILTAKE